MTTDQLLAAGYQATGWVNDYWKFYITFGGLILSARFASRNPWGTAQKVVVTALFGIFAILNAEALFRAYSVLTSIAKSFPAPWQAQPGARQLLQHFDMPWWRWRLLVHAGADLVVIACIWFPRRGGAWNEPSETGEFL